MQKELINALWKQYLADSQSAQTVIQQLNQWNLPVYLDHLAIIDLPGEHSGIPLLKTFFEQLDFEYQGKGYLHEKQNDFIWLAPGSNKNTQAINALPQIVIADFRLHELPKEIQNIVSRCASYYKKPSNSVFSSLETLLNYLCQRPWPLITLDEFHTVHAFNPLLAWVLVFGRKVNHFGIAMHLYSKFGSLNEFNQQLCHSTCLLLNNENGLIKGNGSSGIEQSSTAANFIRQTISPNKTIRLAEPFMEFVWRFPNHKINVNQYKTQEKMWNNYSTHFVGDQANTVIESIAR